MPENTQLEARIHAALIEAVAEGRLDVVEHLLQALEVLDHSDN